MAKRGLGRGLDALIPTDVTAAELPDSVAPATGGEVVQPVPVGAIEPNPHQPRRQFDATELAGLADSIKQHGIVHPPVVSRRADGRYELIAGERRVRAAKLAGLKEVPVIVRSYDEQQKLELALLENVQRSQLNPIETATAYQQLLNEFNLTLDQLASRMGKAKSTVANTLRLLALPSELREAVAGGKISEAHGRALLAVADPAAQAQLLRHIVEDGWSVRQAEQFSRSVKQPGGGRDAAAAKAGRLPAASPQQHSQLADALSDYLNTTVMMQPRAKGGRLVIEYKNDTELQRILDTIKLPDASQ